MGFSERFLDEFCREVVLRFDDLDESEHEFFHNTWREEAKRLYALATQEAGDALREAARAADPDSKLAPVSALAFIRRRALDVLERLD